MGSGDVEQRVLQQLTSADTCRVDDVLGRHVRSDHQTDVLEYRGEGALGCRLELDDRDGVGSISTAHVPLGSPQRSITAGWSCPACPPPGRPRPPQRSVPDARAVVRRSKTPSTAQARAITRTASNASAASTVRPDPKAREVPAIRPAPARHGPVAPGDPLRSRSLSVGLRSVGINSIRAGLVVRMHDLSNRVQGDITEAAETLRDNASNRAGTSVDAKCGRSASKGIEDGRRHPTRIVGAEAPTDRRFRRGGMGWATPPRNRTGPTTCQRRGGGAEMPSARDRPARWATPRGMTSRPSSRRTSSTRSADWTMSGRQLGGVTVSTPSPGPRST